MDILIKKFLGILTYILGPESACGHGLMQDPLTLGVGCKIDHVYIYF